MSILPCIEIQSLTKRYSTATVDTLQGIDLTINQGDKFGILGPNGAGKTTLISILCGILEPSEGAVHYSQHQEALPTNSIGFVPQEYSFFEELNPMQNLEYFGAMYGLTAKVIKERTQSILTVLGLGDVQTKKINTFSGGMKRRVNLAIGIIHQPSILFLDEPTVGVDVQSKVAILKFLNQLNTTGTTIIYTSHHLDEAQEFCNQIALIDQGKIIIKGATEDLLTNHSAKDLKELFIQFTGEAYRD
mgnify:CR=1 FL=1